MAKYLKDLYEQADEMSPDGRWSLMVCTAPVGETAVDSLAHRRHTKHIMTQKLESSLPLSRSVRSSV